MLSFSKLFRTASGAGCEVNFRVPEMDGFFVGRLGIPSILDQAGRLGGGWTRILFAGSGRVLLLGFGP